MPNPRRRSLVSILGFLLAVGVVRAAIGDEPVASPAAPLASLGSLASVASVAAVPAEGERRLEFGRFGTFSVVSPSAAPPTAVALLLATNPEGAQAASLIAALRASGVLVIAIDATRYEQVIADHGGCVYSAADFETLSHWVQQTVNLPDYLPPVLVADGGASTLAYATLAQAPPGTFEGAITLGFCAELGLEKPLCPGEALRREPDSQHHGFLLRPSPIDAPWVVIDGESAPACPLEGFKAFVGRIPSAQLLPATEAGGTAPADLASRVRQALATVLEKRHAQEAAGAALSSEIRDLPVIEMAAPAGGFPRKTLVVAVSGDGGWVGYERKLSERLHDAEGFPIVGLNSLRYFWQARTPDGAAADLGRLLEHYLAVWGLDDAIVFGYSQGADVVPFMVARLPEALRARVRLTVIVGSDGSAVFDTHLSSYMSQKSGSADLPVAPEVRRLKQNKVLCVSGTKEKHSLCKVLGSKRIVQLVLPTGHVFNHDLGEVVASILSTTGLPPAPPKPEASPGPGPGPGPAPAAAPRLAAAKIRGCCPRF
ncbi:MAG: AcvB/VirJ family lysyl-phosphatidylglycerol hydrolase, partial [Acidobacteriota bacterium]